MKKILCIGGSVLYSILLGYLIWLAMYYAVPYIVHLKWWSVLIYLLFGTLLIGIVVSAIGIIMLPFFKMCKHTKIARVLAIFPLLFYGYSCVMLPWHLDCDFVLPQYISSIIYDIDIATIFLGIIEPLINTDFDLL